MSNKNELDQYYTKRSIAELCVAELKQHITDDECQLVIEPSAGTGVFLGFFKNTIAFDVDPKHDDIIDGDFLKQSSLLHDFPFPENITVLGNPPFGFAASMAVKFFNHATTMADTIAFIVPRTFEKESVQKKLNQYYHLVFEMPIPKNSFILHDETYDVPCVFQIWKRMNFKRTTRECQTTDFSFVKKENLGAGGFCVRRAGGSSGRVLDGIDHTEASTYFIQPHVDGVLDIMKLIDFSDVVEKTAGVKSLSKNELICRYLEKKNEI